RRALPPRTVVMVPSRPALARRWAMSLTLRLAAPVPDAAFRITATPPTAGSMQGEVVLSGDHPLGGNHARVSPMDWAPRHHGAGARASGPGGGGSGCLGVPP